MRFHSFRTPVLPLALVLGLLSTGCATSGAPEPSTDTPGATEEAAWAFFIDANDSGDDIWSAGCHYKCSDAECDGATEFWGGDWCVGDNLQEWTHSDPHAAASDIKRYSCNEACTAKGFPGGRCVRVEKACGDTWPSSRCECDDSEPAS